MVAIEGGEVRPHVQAFADAVSAATGAESFGTYPGHQPTIDRATDIFTPIDSSDLGNAITDFAFDGDHWTYFGLTYVIYRQRINSNDGRGWRLMEDRGSPTQNHMDHVHVSYDEWAPATPSPSPPPDDGFTADDRSTLTHYAATIGA